MLKIFRDTHYQFREEIRKLYLDTFSKGESAQHVDSEELDNEIRLAYEEGMMMVAVDENDETKLNGALFVYPLHYVERFNPQLSEVQDKMHTPYIAEIMVHEKLRGQGIGRKMLNKTMSLLKENRSKEVFIRVWQKNVNALRLYKNAGFEMVGKMLHAKWLPDMSAKFFMDKLYLKRGL
ncbi:hypothetical protein MASR2M117_00800 [Paludibacter sp.]